MNWFYLALAIGAEVIGTSALKASNGFSNWTYSLVCIVGYGAAFYFLSLVLRTIPIGVAYAIWSGVGVALITVIGYFAFDQKLNLPAIGGIGLIVLGVIVLNLNSSH